MKKTSPKNSVAKQNRYIGYITLTTITLFILFWISSGFRTAVAIILFGFALLYGYRALKNSKTRLRKVLIASVFLILSMIIMPPSPNDQVAKQSVTIQTNENAQNVNNDKNADNSNGTKIEAEKAKLAKAQEINPSNDTYQVAGITDGDTIKVWVEGKKETIRLIGLDTPETKDPRKPVQCFGKQATSKMQSFVQQKKVRLSADASQDNRDKYGRLLRYVFLEDGRNVAYEMILKGYGHEYTYNLAYKYQSQFNKAEKIAKAKNAGLWSSKTCNGNTTQNYEKKPQPSNATSSSRPKKSTPSSTYYENCTAARNAGAAPVYRGQPGYGTHLDRDDDGVGCE